MESKCLHSSLIYTTIFGTNYIISEICEIFTEYLHRFS